MKKIFGKQRGAYDGSQRQEGGTKGLILLSGDELINHSVMTICKDEGSLYLLQPGEEELNRIIDQCLKNKGLALLVFDNPETMEGILSKEKSLA